VRDDRWKGGGAGLHYQYLSAAVTALHRIPEELEQLQQAALVLSDESSLSPSAVTVLQRAVEGLLEEIGSDPEMWIRLGSRRFEEVLAEIWAGLGWEAVLTPPSKDGGFDIRAIRNASGMCLCYLVEAKAYRPDRPVGIAAVRHLYGVVERERASHGVIATTSRFTRDAQAEAATLKYRVTLADFQQVLGWVTEYRRLRASPQRTPS
jgi:restriction endonuclease Mrr